MVRPWGRLGKAYSRRGELPALVFRKTLNGVTQSSCGVVTAAVPVDLAATACERPWLLALLGFPESSAKRIDRALNRPAVSPAA